MITSSKLLKQKKISHGFFNRKGGKSSGIYKSLNCGTGSNDKKNLVKKNLKIVKNKINKKSKNIFLLHQVHSNKLVFIGKNFRFSRKKIKADAIVSDQKNTPIAVLTADCVPILLYENKKNMIAAIHAGWKGAFKGIINNVINFMIKKGCKRKSIFAAVGPCIGRHSYIVKDDFKKKFLKKDKENKIFFNSKNDLIYFDLPNFVKSQLKINKIANIDMKNIDTFNKKNNFFSARQALKSKHDDYGRNISIIMIN
ncbi:peptidoglycan editing factor PgeF [Pelagibacterales bacterium SAG-MED07]|nr:peptidoglycan editing factor PgeF [Pelagibacterales bacterium SAG-MED07]